MTNAAGAMARPSPSEYAQPYEAYVKLVPETDIVEALQSQGETTQAFLRGVPELEAGRRHAPYTWSVKQVVGHVADAERIFGARALRFARNDPTPLPGFDENPYVDEGHFDDRTLADIARELELIRLSHVQLFRGLRDDAWSRSGIASTHLITVRALAYVIAGHERHHISILRKRLAGAVSA
jgi:DinB family protein